MDLLTSIGLEYLFYNSGWDLSSAVFSFMQIYAIDYNLIRKETLFGEFSLYYFYFDTGAVLPVA